MAQPSSWPRAAYLHIPFCRHHCGYCNFTVVAGRDDLVGDFLRAVELELQSLESPREVDTLYFGGGTPTHLPAAQLEQLCELAKRWHPLADGYEWTVEANPGDLDVERIEVLAQQGVNRVSLGVQSLNNGKLAKLERDHTAEDVRRVIAQLEEAGIGVSIDLIFAAPGETLVQWQADVEAALSFAPNHLSVYGLTYEQGTTFWNRRLRGDLSEVEEESQREMYLWSIDRLAAEGILQYEVSNFARPGFRSRHNQVYWAAKEYYAAGPGAARYVDGARETNHRSTTAYLKRVLAGESPVAEREVLDEVQRNRERIVLGLRRNEGINRENYLAATGRSLDEVAGVELAKFIELGLLADDGNAVRLTREGLLVSDSIWPELL
ncbi:radical SAM family heme chaperone HemW [Adhaeretor mobilis]|uniref:Heme chaperone HemW n=1 Tax=Adhaeretor mobilis TaxID=1930276 RepID=A0A517MS71_9BACT|nr:radical SAM family heme chaperone HemW [Adhaeretor mobilis]QDS97731.1 Oxygen-independent coproporphyrinogen-III oxidase-like protein [Adhaeretor mobilis]